MTENLLCDTLDKLRGAIMIVYPMNLPPYDHIRMEFEGNVDLTGTQVSYTCICILFELFLTNFIILICVRRIIEVIFKHM